MNKRIKLCVISLFIFSSVFTASAQLGIQFGYAYSPSNGNLALGETGGYTGAFKINGFQAGLTYDFILKNNFGLQTGLLYTFGAGKNTEEKITAFGITGNLTTKSKYQFLDLPLRVVYWIPVIDDFKLYIFGGPNFTFNLKGDSEGEIRNSFTTRKILRDKNVYTTFDNDLSRFDLKLGAGAGVQYKQLRFRAGYDFGILNQYIGDIEKNSSGKKYSSRRGQFNLSFAYILW